MVGNQLKEYIRRVYMLERSLYEQNALKSRLNDEIRIYAKGLSVLDSLPDNADPILVMSNMFDRQETPYKQYEEERTPTEYGWYFDSEKMGYVMIAFAFIPTILGFLYFALHDAVTFMNSVYLFLTSIIAIPIGIAVYSIFVLFQYLKGISETKEQNRKIRERNEKKRKYNSQKLTERNVIMKNIQREVKELDIRIQQTKQLLNKYYNENIIYGKYRHNIIAISSFYEYLDSGRCSSLEGHEGAYNIYEMEIRLSHIIGKLDDVLENLNDIKNSQRKLYDAICESNSISNKILYGITESNERLSDLSKQNEVMIYNQRIITQNTEFLKWVEIFKNY